MATSGQLVEAVAKALDIPVATVALYDRALSEAGLRTKGGRGRSAATMTARDAALLLISIVASPITGPTVAGAVEFSQKYATLIASDGEAGTIQEGRNILQKLFTLPLDFVGPLIPKEAKGLVWLRPTARNFNLKPLDLPNLKALPEEHTLLDAVEALFMDAMNDRLRDELEFAREFDRVFVPGRGLRVVFHSPWQRAEISIETSGWYETLSYRNPQGGSGIIHYGQSRFIGIPAIIEIAWALSQGRDAG